MGERITERWAALFVSAPIRRQVKAYTMTLKSPKAGKPSEDVLRSARFIYQRLARSLQTLVERLEGGLESDDSAATQKQLQGHFKTLQQIVDIEVQLGKREKQGSGGEAALDLDAARREICDRLLKRTRADSAE